MSWVSINMDYIMYVDESGFIECFDFDRQPPLPFLIHNFYTYVYILGFGTLNLGSGCEECELKSGHTRGAWPGSPEVFSMDSELQ